MRGVRDRQRSDTGREAAIDGSDALPAAQSGGLIGSMETRAGERMQGRLALLNPARRESSALGSERPRVLRVRGTGHLSSRVPATPSLLVGATRCLHPESGSPGREPFSDGCECGGSDVFPAGATALLVARSPDVNPWVETRINPRFNP